MCNLIFCTAAHCSATFETFDELESHNVKGIHSVPKAASSYTKKLQLPIHLVLLFHCFFNKDGVYLSGQHFDSMLLKKLISSRHLKLERLLGKRKAQKKSIWPWESAFLLRNISPLNKSNHLVLAVVSKCDQHHWQYCRSNCQQKVIYLLRNDLTTKIPKAFKACVHYFLSNFYFFTKQ